ncbi:tRNA pseudouridine(55) synthase TruB [Herbiconiux sp.]|uniref:tRNA pseudouridine(55) synthase TruB n=1 Tax=Herbiconiux sp. TaxID=1871186 RepID=UPI0025BD2B10|nr:tRNA pseudouridine(55) synthase TruB [Herbiconiux sp.]
MKSASSAVSGILLVDKPAGFTSHDAVARTRRLAGTRKVGHAGTLDPMATGLLVLGVNSSTRLLTFVVGLDKEYLATVRLGAATTTDDAEGELLDAADPTRVRALTEESIGEAFAAQRGTIVQVPSSVSAIKVDGKRAYARVRAGEDVVLDGRTVTISEIELLGGPRPVSDASGEFVDIDVRVVCSSGTYIRAIARDVGALLGVGGHLTALRRTRIGPFGLADTHTLDELADSAETGAALPLLTPASVAGRLFPVLEVDTDAAAALGHGQRIDVAASPALTADGESGPVAAITGDGRLVGLVAVTKGRGKSIVNFPPDEYAPPAGATP